MATQDATIQAVRTTDASGVSVLPTAVAAADGLTLPTTTEIIAVNALYNGATEDLMRNNVQGTLLASAARGTTTTSPVQTNYNARGVMLFTSITSVGGGSLGITYAIQAIDPVTGHARTLSTGPAALTTTGDSIFTVYPGIAVSATTNSTIIPRSWQVVVTLGDAFTYTYSIGFIYIV